MKLTFSKKTKVAAAGATTGVVLFFVGKTVMEVGGVILTAFAVATVGCIAGSELKKALSNNTVTHA